MHMSKRRGDLHPEGVRYAEQSCGLFQGAPSGAVSMFLAMTGMKHSCCLTPSPYLTAVGATKSVSPLLVFFLRSTSAVTELVVGAVTFTKP